MSAEDRVLTAIKLTREILLKTLESPFSLIAMANSDVGPDEVEWEIACILEYLEKTAPEKPQEA